MPDFLNDIKNDCLNKKTRPGYIVAAQIGKIK